MAVSVKESRREYFVGGALQTQSWWLFGISRLDLIAGGIGLGGLVVFVSLRQPILGIVTFILSAVVIVGSRIRTLAGKTTSEQASGFFTRLLLSWAGFNRHDGRGRPAAFGDMQVVAVEVSGHELGLVETGKGAGACLSAVFKLDPQTVGAGDWGSDDWRAAQMSRLVSRLGASSYPVEAIQIISRVYPTDFREWRKWQDEHLSSTSSELNQAISQVSDDVAVMTCSVETYLAVKIPMNRLAGWATSQGVRPQSREDLYEIAASVLDSLVADAASFGLRPVKVLSPSGLQSLLRGWLDCSFFLDEPVVGHDDDWWPVAPWRVLPGDRSLVVDGQKGFWLHCAGVIKAGDWPAWTVHADLLAELVRDVEPGQIRTVSVTWVPMSQKYAMERARASSAMAQAGQEQLNKKGSVGSGVEEDQQDAAHWLLRDLRSGASGVGVVARVGVAGRDVSALNRSRADADRIAVGAGMRISWCDGDQVRGVVAGLPLGMGARQIKQRGLF